MSGEADAFASLQPALTHHIVNTLGWRSLRPLQAAAIGPLLAGEDAVLVAPTAGGKTEAAMFPLLTAMDNGRWRGVSVLYLCPIKALLNNLEPRLTGYTGWLGRTVALWHGDVGAGPRRAALREPPDVLLTTPESLEAILVSANIDHRSLLGAVRAVVVDEVHAFAGDDRGWHLLALLERLSQVTARPIQRIGLSATVGNPAELLTWLQGSGAGKRPGHVIAPDLAKPEAASAARADPAAAAPLPPPAGDIELDYVGSLENAATVIAALHKGDKRLVFCDSRRQVEQLGEALRARGVTAFLSHASLSAEERRRSELAFAEARDCVIVATSTLELGIDVGDLDRVIQIDSPTTVASFLQRLGRTGRRPDTTRNCLFLTTDEGALLRASGLLLLWGSGWVEPVTAPLTPTHLVAQQLLALCLQDGKVGDQLWPEAWNGLPPFDHSAEPIVRYLRERGFVDEDGGMLFIGPQAEKHFGRRHFMELTASFTAAPQFTVFAGRSEIGSAEPALLTEQTDQPRRLLLAGRSWQVTHIDWARRRCYVEPVDGGGRAKWNSTGSAGLSFALVRAMRDAAAGDTPPVRLTRRATSALATLREPLADVAPTDGNVITRDGTEVWWWTWAGYRANLTLAASFSAVSSVIDHRARPTDLRIRLRPDIAASEWNAARAAAIAAGLKRPAADPRAVEGLKFSAALPKATAHEVASARLADVESAARVLQERTYHLIRSKSE
ncbi:DEAD/DEAH box helicase [Actinocrinis sp.]|uniref:DEAD/DEAH box helicase n=1 Tax=Actinocrinis sp. TaxID=1920516 RepID=UPI002BFF1C27|nr:DEAD/DEAH box helicase [Actinocrinis sp.]HXR72812.1 DEAD/DEAH box helicase [Actinocrinis sp.]